MFMHFMPFVVYVCTALLPLGVIKDNNYDRNTCVCVCLHQPKTHPKFDSTTAASLAVSAELGMAAAGARGLTGSLDAEGCDACAKRRLHR